MSVFAVTRRPVGPRRSGSVEAYRRGSRAFALVSLLGLIGGSLTDAVGSGFWERHGLIAGVVANILVVLVSVAVLNEAIERRRNGRWRVLAQYVMLQLVLNARLTWTSVAELALQMPSGARTAAALDAGSRSVRDTTSLSNAVQELLADSERRSRLHDQFANLVAGSDAIFGRWASVMLNAKFYAELIDRHVELANYVSWLGSLLQSADSVHEDGSQSKASQSHPAVQIEGDIGDESLASRIVLITQLAEELDRQTIGVAQQIVSIKWWADRLGVTTLVWTTEASSAEEAVA